MPRGVGAEEGDHAGDVLRLSDPTEYGVLPGALDDLPREHRHALGADEPRGNRVDVDVRRAELDGSGAREAEQRRLARGVVGDSEARPFRLVRADVHHLAEMLLAEDRRRRPDAVEG